jgi:hypothetical protein
LAFEGRLRLSPDAHGNLGGVTHQTGKIVEQAILAHHSLLVIWLDKANEINKQSASMQLGPKLSRRKVLQRIFLTKALFRMFLQQSLASGQAIKL